MIMRKSTAMASDWLEHFQRFCRPLLDKPVTHTNLCMENGNKCANCNKPAHSKCAACSSVWYCSRECQKMHWKHHRTFCRRATAPSSSSSASSTLPASTTPSSTAPRPASTPLKSPTTTKENCFIIRATAKDPKQVLENIADQLEPIHLTGIGNEFSEKRQLERELNWPGSLEVGKFYDHVGTDTWYYYAYGSSKAYNPSAGPRNELGSLVCYQDIYGDIAVVRSGPIDSSYSAIIDKEELKQTVEYYKKNDSRKIFGLREQSRAFRKMGLSPSLMRQWEEEL